MYHKTEIITDWNVFKRAVDVYKNTPILNPWIFRGQADIQWGLESSLYRIFKKYNIKDEERALEIEGKLRQNFIERGDKLLKDLDVNLNNKYVYHAWEYMQHYNTPSRLLDWTSSLYVALYFATSKHLNKDGVIFVLDAANYSMSQWVRDKDVNNERGQAVWSNKYSWRHLHASLELNPHAKRMILIMDPKAKGRMVSQYGELMYTTEILEDHEYTLNSAIKLTILGSSENPSWLKRLVVPKHMKKTFLNELELIGISEKTLFPETSNASQKLEELGCQLTDELHSNLK